MAKKAVNVSKSVNRHFAQAQTQVHSVLSHPRPHPRALMPASWKPLQTKDCGKLYVSPPGCGSQIITFLVTRFF